MGDNPPHSTALRAATPTRRLRERARLHGRVDRERGIIFGVKVVGRTSPNTHGVRGAEGTVYSLDALDRACPLYEGCKVNIDHPPRSRPEAERSSQDRIGQLVNCRVEEGGLYADLHLLTSHPMADRLMEAAETMPEAFALSHNAEGKGEVRNGRYVVTAIPQVHSVDVVADGGTNRSLFEGREMAVQVKVCDVLRDEVLPALPFRSQKLLESLLSGPLHEDRSPLMEAEDGKDHRDHMYKAMRSCEEAGNEEGASGIHKLLAPGKRVDEPEAHGEEKKKDDEEEEDEGQEEPVEEGMGEEGPGEPGAHNEGPDGKGGPGTAWESRQRRRKAVPGQVRLTEAQVLTLCKTAGVEATADVVLAVREARSFDGQMAAINLARRSQTLPRQVSHPRSVSRGGQVDTTAPAAGDSKGWAARLLG